MFWLSPTKLPWNQIKIGVSRFECKGPKGACFECNCTVTNPGALIWKLLNDFESSVMVTLGMGSSANAPVKARYRINSQAGSFLALNKKYGKTIRNLLLISCERAHAQPDQKYVLWALNQVKLNLWKQLLQKG